DRHGGAELGGPGDPRRETVAGEQCGGGRDLIGTDLDQQTASGRQPGGRGRGGAAGEVQTVRTAVERGRRFVIAGLRRQLCEGFRRYVRRVRQQDIDPPA